MVLNELGSRITNALVNLGQLSKIDDAAITEMLKEIGNALISSDVNVKLVIKMRQNVLERAKTSAIPPGVAKGRYIRQVVTEELQALLDPGVQPYIPHKGKSNVIMMVGLQGSGKTTTVTKLAYYYKRKGMHPGLVCADTFRAGAFAQLRQNATRAKVPFYGSDTETDPVVVASAGVEQFRKEGADLIIVDTSGRHKQEEELFVEMEQVAEAVQPDLIIFVMDGSIGQAAFDQAAAFKERVPVGAVIITKLDGHAKGGGALSAVAATKSPIIFLGTGERIPDLQPFNAKSFVERLLGMGDVRELVSTLNDAIPKDAQRKMAEELRQGKFTLRSLRDQFQYAMQLGPLDKVMQMMPGFSNMQLPEGVDPSQSMKHFINILDSMTDKELDCDKSAFPLSPSRLIRIARGSGRPIPEINLLLEQHKMMEKLATIKAPNNRSGIMDPKSLQQLSNALPPGLMQQMGGMNGIKNLMKNFSAKDLAGFLPK